MNVHEGSPASTTPSLVPGVLSLGEVCVFVGLSRSTVVRLEHTGAFPRRRRLSAARVGWLTAEIADWVQTREAVSVGAA
jgi:predicted DNA-binding transcriptional regulator AlpA